MKKKSVFATAAMLLTAAVPTIALAFPPNPAFQGRVLGIAMNSGQVLVQGAVRGPCTGSYANYNLTFDFADAESQNKLNLIRDAFLSGKTIAGHVKGCGSSNLNRLDGLAIGA
jgi:hypothetical protein